MSNFDDNRDWANSFSEFIEHATNEEIINFLDKLEDKWSIPNSFDEHYEKIEKNLNIEDIDSVDMNYIDIEKDKIVWEITGIYMKFKNNVDNYEDYHNRWEKLFENIYYSYQLIKNKYLLSRIKYNNYDYSLNEDNSKLFKFVPMTSEKNSAYHNMLIYLLETLAENEYARQGQYLYVKIKTKEGYSTYAWKQLMTIRKFILDNTSNNGIRYLKFDQWKNATSGGNTNIKAAENYLLEYEGPELMPLEKDRHVFAFKNGNYLSKINIGTEEEPIWSDLFVEYSKSSKYLNSKTVACKYFDQEFIPFDSEEYMGDSWFKIMDHCPNLRGILDYQEFPEEVQKWLMVFMGRWCFEIGELDSWACIMYLLGAANAGKSTLLTKVLYKFFEEVDIGMIANNIEKKFGLKAHITKYGVLAPEIDQTFQMEQTDWQLICEGGRNTFAEKGKTVVAEGEVWKPQMAMAGNRLPGYNNNSGSYSRRIAVWYFKKPVIEVDTHLDKKLEKEIPMILKMCISGYLYTINKYKNKGIWKILPNYFKEQKEEMEQTTNSLQNFLKSSKIILDKDRYIPDKVFKQAFNDHCRENNLAKQQFTSDYYQGVFNINNITVTKRVKKKYPMDSSEYITGIYYVGVDIINEFEKDSDPE